jgi:hypothetical protein
MAIDDPIGIVICQAEEAVQADAYLPAQLAKLGLSAGAAATIGTTMPFVASVLTNLFGRSSARFERRFLKVAEELNAQQKRIEDKIPDKKYYESEEFQSLLILILEKIHTTHDDEKLRRFAAALANSGRGDFQSDDREAYIRILRDLSNGDLQILNDPRLKGWLPHIKTIQYGQEVLSSLSRLAGMGLVNEKLEMKSSSGASAGSARVDAENALKELLTNPPKRTYYLSPFGEKFLEFICASDGRTQHPI